jgi:hypothetical protein
MKAQWITKNGMVAECVNILPMVDGGISLINPQKNAIIIQYIRGEPVVSIECMDERLYESLMAQAKEILRAL